MEPTGLGNPLGILRAYAESAEVGRRYGDADQADEGAAERVLSTLPQALRGPLRAFLPEPKRRSGGAVEHYDREAVPPAEALPGGLLRLDGLLVPAGLPEALHLEDALRACGYEDSERNYLLESDVLHSGTRSTSGCTGEATRTSLARAAREGLRGCECLEREEALTRALLLLAAAAAERMRLSATHAQLTWRGRGYVYRWDRHGQPHEQVAALLVRSVVLEGLLPELAGVLESERAWVEDWRQLLAEDGGTRRGTRIRSTAELVRGIHARIFPHSTDRFASAGGSSEQRLGLEARAEAEAEALRLTGNAAVELLTDLRGDVERHAARHRILNGYSPEDVVADLLEYGPGRADPVAASEDAERWRDLVTELGDDLGDALVLVPAGERGEERSERRRRVRDALTGTAAAGTRWEVLASAALSAQSPSTGCSHPDLRAVAVGTELERVEGTETALLARVPYALAAESSRYLRVLGCPGEDLDAEVLALAAELALADPGTWGSRPGSTSALDMARVLRRGGERRPELGFDEACSAEES